MDLSLPRLDGWEATRMLKADHRTASVKVIAMSAHAMSAEEERASQAGCDGFISKPCLPEQLLAELVRHRPVAPAPARRRPASKRG